MTNILLNMSIHLNVALDFYRGNSNVKPSLCFPKQVILSVSNQ